MYIYIYTNVHHGCFKRSGCICSRMAEDIRILHRPWCLEYTLIVWALGPECRTSGLGGLLCRIFESQRRKPYHTQKGVKPIVRPFVWTSNLESLYNNCSLPLTYPLSEDASGVQLRCFLSLLESEVRNLKPSVYPCGSNYVPSYDFKTSSM